MSIKQGQISKFFVIFLFVHVLIWTLIPTLANFNLPLDTIEALAWASDIQWGYIKHPPLSAWFAGLVFKIFSNKDWTYYLLSQIFVVSSFTIIWKFSENFFQNQIYSLVSVLLLEGIYFYNFTTPEFNVYVCELPFWALTVLYCWKGIKQNDYLSWLLFGFFAGLGVLSHYLFLYLLISLGLFFIYMIFKKEFNSKCLISLITLLIVLLPHLIWLTENNFITITYALHRTGLEESNFLNHLYYPLIFLAKQIGILAPFFIMLLFIISKFKYKINFEDKKLIFLIIINIMPIFLIFLTSFFSGAKLRTMWMTPFYLFIGVFLIYIFESKINFNKIKYFLSVFLIIFIFSPMVYYFVAVTKKDKRTNYPGKEIAQFIQTKWNNSFSNKIGIVFGNEWDAGNLSYNLKSRPKWTKEVPQITDVGIVVIGDYNDIKYVNEVCNSSVAPSHIVLIQVKSFHNVCMIGKK